MLFVFNQLTPFIVAMQHPSRKVVLGYAYEHHHCLKQWVRSCSLIIGNTENEDVQFFEIENVFREFSIVSIIGIEACRTSKHT